MENHKTTYLSVKDYLVSGEPFDLIYDPALDFLKTFPQPNPEELPRYYESQNYISHTDEKKGLLSGIYQLVKSWSLKKKLSLFSI